MPLTCSFTIESFKDFWARPPAQTLYAHFSDTIDDNHGEVYHRATAHAPVKEQASVLVLCLCMYELWMSGGRGGISAMPPPPPPKPQNHLKERGLDQAQARASYTPLFKGHSRSIPQGMI